MECLTTLCRNNGLCVVTTSTGLGFKTAQCVDLREALIQLEDLTVFVKLIEKEGNLWGPLRRESSGCVITWNVQVYKTRRETNSPFNFSLDVSVRKHNDNASDDHKVQTAVARFTTTMPRCSQADVAARSRSICRLRKARQPLLPSGFGTENPARKQL